MTNEQRAQSMSADDTQLLPDHQPLCFPRTRRAWAHTDTSVLHGKENELFPTRYFLFKNYIYSF